jgi:hypothetical protein
MFNFLKPQISADEAGKSIVYGLAQMVSGGELSIENLSRCDNDDDVRAACGPYFNEKFVERFFNGDDFLRQYRQLNVSQRATLAKAVLMASKNMRDFIDQMVSIYGMQKAVIAGGGKAHHISWRFPEFSQYESEFKTVKDALAGAFRH